MQEKSNKTSKLPDIPEKRYFTIGEVANLLGIKQHVLRYWEHEFQQLNPIRREKRRYYRHNEVLLIFHIKTLLHDDGYTIEGARGQLKLEKKKLDAPHYFENNNPNAETLKGIVEEVQGVITLLKDIV